MFILSLIGALGILAGGFSVWVGNNENDVFWMAVGLSSAISGVLFLALDKGLTLLTDIRDALVNEPVDGADQ